MTSEEFITVFGDIDDDFVLQARSPAVKRRLSPALSAVCLAACAAAAVLAGIFADSAPVLSPDAPYALEINAPAVAMSSVTFNELDPLAPDAARAYYDPELYDTVIFDGEAVREYYGRDLTPPYVPEGLSPSESSGTAQFIIGKDGTVAEDTVWLHYYRDFYTDGSPMPDDGIPIPRGFTLGVSKLGLLGCCLYLHDEVIATDIAGTEVTFGHCAMPYGPYAPETHEPSGYYDLYTAEFTVGGVSYKLTAERLTAEDVVRTAASIIYGEPVDIIK